MSLQENLRYWFVVGDRVRVIGCTDETLPEEFVGRMGIVKRGAMSYQTIGDDPVVDPLVEVMHGPAYGKPAQKQIYWREEIERT